MARTAEETREAKRLHMERRRKENPDAVREYQRKQHHKNRDRNVAKMRDYYARRFFWSRAMKLRGNPRANYRELASLWKAQRGLCAITGRRLTRENAELDHIVAKVRGGSDHAANLRWTIREVNRAKRDLSDAEFLAICSDAMRWIGRRIEMVDRLEVLQAMEAA